MRCLLILYVAVTAALAAETRDLFGRVLPTIVPTYNPYLYSNRYRPSTVDNSGKYDPGRYDPGRYDAGRYDPSRYNSRYDNTGRYIPDNSGAYKCV